MGEVLHRMLERNARKDSSKLALRVPANNISLSWDELNRKANTLAHFLKEEKQIKRGDRVAVFIPNRAEFVIGIFAIWKAGGVVIPINVKFTESEVGHILQDSSASLILADGTLAGRIKNLTTKIVTTDFWVKIYTKFSDDNLELEISPLELAELLYTSGTTGKPKGVMLSHNAVHSVASMFSYEMDIRYRDKVLHLMPLTHSAPLNLLLVGAIYAGAANVIGDFSPKEFLEITSQEKTTHFFGAPVAYLLTAKLPDFNRYDLSSAKCWIYGGAPMTKEQVILVQSKYPGNLVGVYGLTESGPNGTALYPEDHPAHAGTIGRRGVVNSEIKVVDENGEEVIPGIIGEIIMRTPSLMNGYWNNPKATAEAIKDGWLYTGDMAKVDDEGYITIIDRKKDIIISGGVNIYPREVEAVLRQHPTVEDVTVVGIPHPDWGESVMALIVSKEQEPNEEELKQFASEKLASYKVPRIITFTSEIPRNSSGKILKHIIIEKYGNK